MTPINIIDTLHTNSNLSMSPTIVSIEGNIGVGKSTLINQIELYLIRSNITDVIVLKEPVEEWTDIVDSTDGESVLTKFYNDPEKFSFSFQVLVLNTLLKLLKKTIELNPKCRVIICERSILSSRQVFAKMLFNSSKMNEVEYKIYESLFDNDMKVFTPSKIVYINVAPEVCLQRILKRNRSAENEICLDYLIQCDKYHQKWLLLTEYDKTEVLTICCDDDVNYDSNPNDGYEWIKQIIDFSTN